jgi:hypothetical protein
LGSRLLAIGIRIPLTWIVAKSLEPCEELFTVFRQWNDRFEALGVRNDRGARAVDDQPTDEIRGGFERTRSTGRRQVRLIEEKG